MSIYFTTGSCFSSTGIVKSLLDLSFIKVRRQYIVGSLYKMSAEDIERLKERLNLRPHPADMGYLAETWRAQRLVSFNKPTRHDGARVSSSSVYFLIDGEKFVNWHMLLSDEFLYWHAGGELKVHLIDKDGNYSYKLLGNTLKNEENTFFTVVPHETWMAAERVGDCPYVFYSASSVPGWELKDSIDGNEADMLKKFPQHADKFERLCTS